MIRIMIVDDMPIFLEYLRGCIDWNSYGFEICCEAHDGKEALEKLDEYYPDVVLTDITMPYLNGLELAEKITKDYPDISVILITGNNEFEYARQAVKIGVCDYIVKPFEKEELILSLLKLQDNIGKAVESTEDKKEMNYDELRALIYAGVSDDEQAGKLEKTIFGNVDAQGGYLVSLLRFDADAFLGKDTDAREKLMNWEKLIARMLADRLDIQGKFRIFHDFENNIVVLMRFDRESDLDSYKGYELSDLIQIIKSQLSIGSSIAISKALSFREVKNAYERCLSFLNSKGYGQLWDIRNNREEVNFSSLEAIIRLNKDIESLKADDAEKVLTALWDKLHTDRKENEKVSFTDMNLLTSAISILMTNIINSGFSIEKIYGDGFLPEKFMSEAGNSDQMLKNVIYLYRKRIEFEKNKSDSKTHNVAQAAKEYIEKNYENASLSISDISETLCVNQTYLRKMFKSEMNMTLTEYITQFRMQKAKHLLTTTDEKLSVIAENVGYSDVSYFSNVFKKFYGQSPRSMSR
ncbi:response regulator transcription factor [Butyrivibrio sp. YAB3001]|uniref:response regulator transcription factor n=1 Tax=Butyrivibrio sp. YAB3001 TaxID=1520812 RepID=UPI0008F64E6E|nr:response regulator [Butyrivibrio sp. YAB3001]SFD02859.1 two-component system, response regulator YesN [Butyrivibrio sp. YAB3001]